MCGEVRVPLPDPSLVEATGCCVMFVPAVGYDRPAWDMPSFTSTTIVDQALARAAQQLAEAVPHGNDGELCFRQMDRAGFAGTRLSKMASQYRSILAAMLL